MKLWDQVETHQDKELRCHFERTQTALISNSQPLIQRLAGTVSLTIFKADPSNGTARVQQLVLVCAFQ